MKKKLIFKIVIHQYSRQLVIFWWNISKWEKIVILVIYIVIKLL